MGFLTALLPLLAGITDPIKNYFAYKQQVVDKEQEYKIALLQSQVEMAKAQDQADATELHDRLNATTQNFKQSTFWFLCVPVVFTMLFPTRAAEMWNNFKLIPDFIQWLFLSVYSAIWGIPIVKGGYGAVTDLLQNRRDYALEKAKINRKAVFDVLKAKLFLKGMTQEQVDIVDKALNAGEDNEAV